MNSTSNLIRLLFIAIAAILLQVVVLDNLDLVELCNPFIYVVVILSAPFGLSPIMTMLLALPTGLAVDLASNTPGMHAAACVLIAYLRQYVLSLLSFRAAYRDDAMPSVYTYGTLWYLKYAAVMVLIHHMALFFIEQFDGFFVLPTLLRIIISAVVSTALIVLFSYVAPKGHDAEG